MNPKENLISDDLVDDLFEIDYSELTDFDPKNFDLVEYFDEETRSNFDSPEPLTTPVPSTTIKSTTTTTSASGELGTQNLDFRAQKNINFLRFFFFLQKKQKIL